MPQKALPTIQCVSAPRLRKPLKQKPPPIPTQQRREKLTAYQDRQCQIDEAVSEWYSYTLMKADDLGKRFNKKPCYFMDLFFQGGVKLVMPRNKVNMFNAFKSLKAEELNEGLGSTYHLHYQNHLTCTRGGSEEFNHSPGRISRRVRCSR
jgi:hypothetical protein